MDAIALLAGLMARTFFLAMPLGVAWLAFRRLALSETRNAWIYALAGLFAAFSAAGLAPWALGLQTVGWAFFLFSALCPPLWVGVVLACGIGRVTGYDLQETAAGETSPDDAADRVVAFRSHPTPAPLILEAPEWPDAPRPVFRHQGARSSAANIDAPAGQGPLSGIMAVARAMRGRPSSAPRRLRPLLPPPDKMPDLPFLRRGR